MWFVEFINEDGGLPIAVCPERVSFIEAAPDDRTSYIVTAGNRGICVRHSYADVLKMLAVSKCFLKG